MPWVVILVVSMIYRVFVLRTKNEQVQYRFCRGPSGADLEGQTLRISAAEDDLIEDRLRLV